MAKEEVKVTILDRQFAVNCQKGEKEALMEAASFLDSQIRTIQQQTKLVGLDRCAIIAALNISSELLRFRQGDSAMDLVSGRIHVIGERIDDAIREVRKNSVRNISDDISDLVRREMQDEAENALKEGYITTLTDKARRAAIDSSSQSPEQVFLEAEPFLKKLFGDKADELLEK